MLHRGTADCECEHPPLNGCRFFPDRNGACDIHVREGPGMELGIGELPYILGVIRDHRQAFHPKAEVHDRNSYPVFCKC